MAKIDFKENGSKGGESKKNNAQEVKELGQAKTIKELGEAINLIDALSQEGFSEIEAIARLALLSLQTPEGYRHLDNIAYALKAISTKAGNIQDCINSEAEIAGFNYSDKALYRRWESEKAFRNSEGAQA